MHHSKKNKILISILVLLLSGCGYRAQGTCDNTGMAFVAIPLIPEDDDGVLRNALARAISETGRYRYSSESATYELLIKFENNYTDTIGYEWDVNAATGAEVKRLYPDEGRKTVVVLVTLQDSKTKEKVLEPFKVSVQANYDFVNPVALKDIEFRDFMGREQTTLQYSLGQLDSEEGARSEVSGPLFQDLANRIAEILVRAPSYKRVRNADQAI